jgi:pyrroloquinoline quinone biosynthesis protein D
MNQSAHPSRLLIAPASRPRLRSHVKMRRDEVRGHWTILAPERVFTPDDIAVAVLQLCDGVRDLDAIAAQLAQTYNAPAGDILADILPMLQNLADKGVIEG